MADMDFIAGIVSFAAASSSLGAGRELSSPTASLVSWCVPALHQLNRIPRRMRFSRRLRYIIMVSRRTGKFFRFCIVGLLAKVEPKAERLGDFMAYAYVVCCIFGRYPTRFVSK
ncbi:hypothetical protein OROHE_009377 [Orobanche hederae]